MKFQMRKKLEQETKDTGKTLQKTITKTKYKVQKTLVLMQIYRNQSLPNLKELLCDGVFE